MYVQNFYSDHVNDDQSFEQNFSRLFLRVKSLVKWELKASLFRISVKDELRALYTTISLECI